MIMILVDDAAAVHDGNTARVPDRASRPQRTGAPRPVPWPRVRNCLPNCRVR